MTRRLDRTGIFLARPLEWKVKTFENSESVAVSIDFVILSELDGNAWVSWEGYEDNLVTGDFFVVKRDGTINTKAVEQLTQALGWDGNPEKTHGLPPQKDVQITVKEEEFQGKSYFKVGWMNPGDYKPEHSGGADAGDVRAVQGKFGSLLRAAAASAAKAGAGSTAPANGPAEGKKAAPPKKPAPPARKREAATAGAPVNPVSGEPLTKEEQGGPPRGRKDVWQMTESEFHEQVPF